jgi:putative ABC transport system permease protein
VTNFNISVGQFAQIGQQVFALVDTSNWYLLANYQETDLRGIYIADNLRGKATVIAREGDSRYAFFRGATWLGEEWLFSVGKGHCRRATDEDQIFWFADDDDAEVEEAAPVCVIGETIRKELFGEGVDPTGLKIRLKSMSLEVIGVTAAKGQGGFADDLDDNIITPYTTVLRRLNGRGNGNNISQMMISGQENYPGANIVADVSSLMRERRNVGANEEDNFNVFDSQQLASVISSSTQVMTSLLGAVAGVSLLVGGIGIMNIMLVSVTERTREIGIRLAIGARAREVLLQFLVEAVTLSCIGGVAGILLAYGLCVSLAKVVGAPFLFDPKINIIAFVFSAAIGIIFGFMPARRAAGLDPIEALRHE